MPIPGQPIFIAPADAVDLVLDRFKSWNSTEAEAREFLTGQVKKGTLKLRYTGTRPYPEHLSLTFEIPVQVPVPGAPPLDGGARLIGAQKAGYAAAGVDVGSGSPLDVMGDTVSQLRLAELVKLYEGEWVLDQLDWSAGEVRRRFRHKPVVGEAEDDAGNGEGDTIEQSHPFQIDRDQLSAILLDQLATAGAPPEVERGPVPAKKKGSAGRPSERDKIALAVDYSLTFGSMKDEIPTTWAGVHKAICDDAHIKDEAGWGDDVVVGSDGVAREPVERARKARRERAEKS